MRSFLSFFIFIFSFFIPMKDKTYTDDIKCPSEMDRLAIETMVRINPLSIKRNWEYGGTIYMKGEKLNATPPMTDSLPHNVYLKSLHSLNIKGVVLAHYHTHAAKSEDYVDEEFSEIDTTGSLIDQYLITPGHNVYKFDHASRRVYKYSFKNDIWVLVPIKEKDEEPLPEFPKLRLYDKIPYQILMQ